MKICRAPDCPNKATRKGLCNAHYMREYRRKQKMKPTYEEGIEEGRQQVVEAVYSLISPHGGDCYLEEGLLTLKLQGRALKTRL